MSATSVSGSGQTGSEWSVRHTRGDFPLRRWDSGKYGGDGTAAAPKGNNLFSSLLQALTQAAVQHRIQPPHCNPSSRGFYKTCRTTAAIH
jgi:hypothetical protein